MTRFPIQKFRRFRLSERGQSHHRPHAHIKHRGRRIASVYLETLTLFDQHEDLPAELISRIRQEQENLLQLDGVERG